ncbi:MAG: hypothetical protein M1351_02220 [Candidatus Thermoplasmatota archaeon]|nr:hypothetical protein [Candidatus Thermoplasmatota archaeon]
METYSLLKVGREFDTDCLSKLRWERKDDGVSLRSSIELRDTTNLSKKWIEYEANHQSLITQVYVEKENGSDTIKNRQIVVPTRTTLLSIPGLLVIEGASNRKWILEVIMAGADPEPPPDGVYKACIDTDTLMRDTNGHWVKGWSGRRGRVNRGTFYGIDIEQDEEMSGATKNTGCNRIGWTTYRFGGATRASAIHSGSFEVRAEPTPSQLLDFVKKDILPYVIDCSS